MSDEKTEEKVTSTDATPSDDGGDKSKEDDPIERAYEAAKRMEKANIERSNIIREEKELEAKRIMGGQALAGLPAKKKEEISPEDYLGKVLKGDFNVKA